MQHTNVAGPPAGIGSHLAGEVLLQVAGVTHAHGAERVLDRVDLTVRRGKTVTVVGPNGAGKTTLLRIAMGLLVPQAGTVQRRSGLRIGYVPQSFAVDATLPLSVDRLLATASRSPAARAELLREVGVDGLGERPLQVLSGGELRRVLLARALAREPELLVLDEPVQGVDIAGQAELYDLIARAVRSRGCGVLMVSHDLHLVMSTTDRVLCLNRHVCCEGAPESVGQHPEYLALFGGVPRGLAVYTHHHDHAHDEAGAVVPLEGGHSHPRDHAHDHTHRH